MNPRLTLIVPVYNTMEYLAECLDSLLAQTLFKSEPDSMEILLINDASTDGSAAILRQYQSLYPNLFYVIEQNENQGLGATRNLGLEQARGDYIGFVDSDDKVHPAMFEKLLSAAQRQPTDYVEAGMSLFHADGSQPLILGSSAESTSVCNKLFNNLFIQEFQLEFAEGELFEDEVFSYLASYYANHISSLSETLYYYRVNPTGICRSLNGDKKRLYARMTSMVDFLETLKARALLEPMKVCCLVMVCRHAMLQLKAKVGWGDLICFWRFAAHLINRYGLMDSTVIPPQKDSSGYFVTKFIQLSRQPWRLWLLRHYCRWFIRVTP